ncbi:aspartate-semialdehyde dehydrogenase [Volucribacter psittacicida]|uniref:Aspartate-semialdehyde dehydrogenase n=1 Tax=Volucribacter psittacicida TaxID=203482 RepID=A0A4R1G5L5_9PAST|nr:Asd/ArgC dimerization domain-containing protein [Volucribacter psittacicida]TCK01755.1 aspartate-semialdehyde dehydrogenase [Volucribacter psittacicida]
MNTSLNIAIAAEFSLTSKIVTYLEQTDLAIDQLSIADIYPFNEEQGIRFHHKNIAHQDFADIDWHNIHYLLFAGDIEKVNLLPQVAQAGCIVIDIKGICANLTDIPVVVPSVNEQQLSQLRTHNIVSLPDPQVTQAALALNPFKQNLNQVFITSLLPASYSSQEQVEQLVGQTAQLLNGIPLDEQQTRFAFNVLPQLKANLPLQLSKIFPQLGQAIFHQVQTPVFYGMAQTLTLQLDYMVDPTQIITEWQQHPLVKYYDQPLITPVTNGEMENDQAYCYLHISQLEQTDEQLTLWTVSDEQGFSQAQMAVELLISLNREEH